MAPTGCSQRCGPSSSTGGQCVTARDVTPSEEEPQKVLPKQAESAATALLRLAGEYELVRHTTGVLYALNGTDDPIGLDALIGRLARRYATVGQGGKRGGPHVGTRAARRPRRSRARPDGGVEGRQRSLGREARRAGGGTTGRTGGGAGGRARRSPSGGGTASRRDEPHREVRRGDQGSRRWRGLRSRGEALASRLGVEPTQREARGLGVDEGAERGGQDVPRRGRSRVLPAGIDSSRPTA